ncbi:hypothetical protein D0C36_12855 [Mucilaginibacter conchicola]|uniref:Uncharacterized protein n=1 Tax=Mucilaginibacter conchicola TaxID=2303333 RepID=A0A372NUN2_9SPHI|nr:hypothetical protein [Mucilaginibacter conchicola]RFZ92317.1 hypothetical protein D0C36_12855 [Mucilaginibacter conchicola]
MKMEKATKDRIVRNVFLSLFIFLLPIAAMFATFYFTGERPWETKKQQPKNETDTSINTKNNKQDGSND